MPLTERILARLPGSRLVWVLLWAFTQAMVYLVQAVYGLIPRPWHLRPESTSVFPFIFAYATLVSLWATKRMWSAANHLRPALAGMVPKNRGFEESWPFHSAGSTVGPFIVISVATIAIVGPSVVRAPTLVAGLILVVIPFVNLPLGTLMWVYGSILWGLNQLGGTELRLVSFEEDSSLGLGPFGTLAALAFGLLMLMFGPLMISGAVVGLELGNVVFNFVTLAIFVALLFLSVYRLHLRLVTEKTKHLDWARRRYGQAFRAATNDAATRTVRDRVADLQLSAEVERRAAAIQTWPFDVSAFRIIGAIVSSVVTALIARLVLSRVGL